MRRHLKTILIGAAALMLAQATPAFAEDADVSFGGETYSVAFKDRGKHGNALVELVRKVDTIDSWQKLVAVHRFGANRQSPKEAVLVLASILKKRDPATRYAVIENPKTKEAMIDFLAGEPSSDVVELNVFKYARHPSGKGLVAFQFAEKFVLGKATPGQVKAARDAAVERMAAFDLSRSLKLIDE